MAFEDEFGCRIPDGDAANLHTGGDVKLEEKIDPLPLLFIDPQRISQILFNLIGNAVKFTEHGSVVLTVSFERRDTDGQLVVSVSDTGCAVLAFRTSSRRETARKRSKSFRRTRRSIWS